jgi:cysteine desulfurase
MTRIYLDHNATTPLREEVRERWLEALARTGGNPSSLHRSGREARQLLDEARERTAGALRVDEEEIHFTSGGTESNNLALFGGVRRQGPRAGLLASAVEHSSVLAAAAQLEQEGHPLTLVGVDSHGLLDPGEVLDRAEADGARLVAVMAANNEVGVRMPLEAIGKGLDGLLPQSRPLLFTDAAQALGRVPLPLRAWNIDLASFSAHKIGGPLGVGVLYRRASVELQPLLYGGEQEGGLRPGTENVAAIVAASHAIELAIRDRESFAAHAAKLALVLWEALHEALPDARLLGPELASEQRLPGTLNILLLNVDGKVLVTRLDLEGLELSAGSACASGSLEPSHVLLAMGLSESEARAGLRISIGRDTLLREIREAVEILRKTASRSDATREPRMGL